MPARNQSRIRRDINRLHSLVQENRETHAPFAAIEVAVAMVRDLVNGTWQTYQQRSVDATQVRSERESAVRQTLDWIQRWRPVVIMLVPGTSENIRRLPPGTGTPDEIVLTAQDLLDFIHANPACKDFRTKAVEDLRPDLDTVRKEIRDAAQILPLQEGARAAYSEACIQANAVLIRSIEIVRAIFGPTSSEFRQFLIRNTPEEDKADDADADVGEDGASSTTPML